MNANHSNSTSLGWPNELTLEFIELYGKEPVIWDPKHPHHKNRAALNKAWERIHSNLSVDCSISDLKKKKESLMTSYRMNTRRKKINPEHQCIWFAYEALDKFLADVYFEDELSSHKNQSYTKLEEDDSFSSLSQNKSYSSTAVKRLKPDLISYTSTHYPPIKQENRYLSYREDRDEMDECELYAQLLAKKLRRLNQNERDIAMHRIDNLLFELKMSSAQSPPQEIYETRILKKSKSPVFIHTSDRNDEDYEAEYLEDPINNDDI